MNMRGLQLFGLEPPMILLWVAISQVTPLMKRCIPCSLISLQKMWSQALTMIVASVSDDLFSKQHLTRCDEVYWCLADG